MTKSEDEPPEDQREDRAAVAAAARLPLRLLPAASALCSACFGRRLQLLDDRVGAGVDPAGIIVGLEARQDLVAG